MRSLRYLLALFAAALLTGASQFNGVTATQADSLLGVTANTSVIGMTLDAVGGTPTVTSSSITTNTAGVSSLNLGYSTSVSIAGGGSGGMSAAASGGTVTLGTSTGLPGTSESIPITNRPILGTETSITRSFTQPGNGREATSGGADLATYTTQSVTNSSNVVALDAFTRADAGTLGANWTDIIAGFGIVSNQASATATGPTPAITTYSATTPSANARVSITLRNTPSANIIVLLGLRCDFGAGNGYGIQTDGTTLSLIRLDGYTPTTLTSASVAFASGDVLGFEANGTSLTAYKNGTSVLGPYTDATYSAAQNANINLATTGTQTFAYDNLVIQNLP